MDVSAIRSERIRRAIEHVPDAVRAEFDTNKSLVVKQEPYFSKIRVPITTITKAGGPPALATMIINAGVFTCFDYAIGDSMFNAGFPSAAPYDKATKADTNILSKGETNGGDFFFIDGISLLNAPRTEQEVLRQAAAECYVSASLEGKDNMFKFGNPEFVGGGGGFFGGGEGRNLPPNNQDNRAQLPGFIQNGLPGIHDYKQLQDPILWGPKGKADSTFQVKIEVTRARTWTSQDRAVDLANNITAFTSPVAQAAISDVDGTFWEMFVYLHGIQIGPRGSNR